MRVSKVHDESGIWFELLNDEDMSISEVEGFLGYLKAQGYSPNTLSAYAHDLKPFAPNWPKEEPGSGPS